MMQSLYTSSTGMLAMQTQIDTTANNIANVNTMGYKKSRAEFADLMYKVMTYAGTSKAIRPNHLQGSKWVLGYGLRQSIKSLPKVV